MKAYAAADLNTVLDGELVWRRRELTSLVTLIQTVDTVSQRALIRAGIPLLYAHWEGFGKACITRYLEFVSYRSKSFKELKPSFFYLYASGSFKDIATASPSVAIPLLANSYAKIEDKNKDSFRKKVSTKSNLRADVLNEMLTLCGLDPLPFEPYLEFINAELCDPRNEIAHGAGGAPALSTFIERRNRAFELMTFLQSTIVNGASNKEYLLAA